MGTVKILIKTMRRRIHGKPDIRIGKRGIHPKLIQTADMLLRKRGGIIKIRVLRNIAPTKEDTQKIADQLAKQLNADITKIIGRTIIIGRISDFQKTQNRTLNQKFIIPTQKNQAKIMKRKC